VYEKKLTCALKFSWNWRFRPNIFHTNFRCVHKTWHGHKIFTLLGTTQHSRRTRSHLHHGRSL